MEFIIAESTEDMSRRAADRIASFVEADPSCVLGHDAHRLVRVPR